MPELTAITSYNSAPYLNVMMEHFIGARGTVLDPQGGGGGSPSEDDAAAGEVLDEGGGEVRQARDVHILVRPAVEEGRDIQAILLQFLVAAATVHSTLDQ